MSCHLAKCIDITPNGVLRPGFPQDYREYRKRTDWFPRLLATTSHIRFWVDWPSLQPRKEIAFGDPANPDHFKLAGLDEQIQLANQDGLKTILLPYRYPRWLNGTEGINQPFGWDNFAYKPGDRAALTTWRNWYLDPNNGARTQSLASGIRALEYELPLEDGHGPDSAWGQYVAALFDRYVGNSDHFGRADYFEVVNEPNLQLWPQRSPSTLTGDVFAQFELEGSRLTVHYAVAEMMATMDHISRQYSPRVDLIAPSTSDTDVRTAARRSTIAVPSPWAVMPDGLEHFVPSLLDELDAIGFKAGPKWTWSYHNYNDVERTGDRATALRETLRHRWHGRTRDGGPMLFSSEGGMRLVRAAEREGLDVKNPAHAARIRELQALALDEAFHLHRQRTGVGAGVALFTQYTIFADPNFDCGLREMSGEERPAFGVWCGLKEFDPHDPPPSQWRTDSPVTAGTG